MESLNNLHMIKHNATATATTNEKLNDEKKSRIQFAHKLTAEQNNLLNCFKLIEGCKNYKEHTLEKSNNCTY